MASVDFTRNELGIASLRLNRPQALNALTWEAMDQFAELVDRLADRKDVRALIVHGAGRAFCSGGDLYELHQYPQHSDGERLAATMGDALDQLESLPFPTVAAIEGPALGGGAELALACDLRLMAAGATFGMMHLRLAITPAWGGGQRLLQLVGYGRAFEWLAAARVLTADQAHRHGLALEVVPDGAAYARALKLAADFAGHDPASVRAVKRLLLAGRQQGYAAAQRLERDEFPPLWAAEPHLQASERFVSRRREQLRQDRSS